MKRVLPCLFALLVFASVSFAPVSSIPFCEDNEEGKTTFMTGTIRSGAIESGTERNIQTTMDACASSTSVKEYYCDAGVLRSETIACGAGFMCEMGSCIEKAFYCDGPTLNQTNASLKQSISIGYSIQEKKGAGASYTDECIGNASVKEFYCLPTAKAEQTVSCPSNSPCVDGACVYTPPAIPPQRVTVSARAGKFLFSVPFSNAQVSTTCTGLNVKKIHAFTDSLDNFASPPSLVAGVYWFNAASDCTITLEGTDSNSLSGTLLRAGWNRLGSTNATIQSSALFSNCDLKALVKFNSYSASVSSAVSTTESITPGGAYFAFVKKSCKLK
ncbi:hypothetical protein HY992_03170 [Candidatus Micrarchaeota archaeon]|nr:hypothetical protein [Candidatus Micrarchaeota archaeon]